MEQPAEATERPEEEEEVQAAMAANCPVAATFQALQALRR